jgi:WD40 repeat protein
MLTNLIRAGNQPLALQLGLCNSRLGDYVGHHVGQLNKFSQYGQIWLKLLLSERTCKRRIDVQFIRMLVGSTGDGDNCIRLFGHGNNSGAEGWQQLAVIEGAHSGDINCVRWHPSRAGMLASSGDDDLVRLWQYLES